jgi:hypothetical protein
MRKLIKMANFFKPYKIINGNLLADEYINKNELLNCQSCSFEHDKPRLLEFASRKIRSPSQIFNFLGRKFNAYSYGTNLINFGYVLAEI